MFNDPVAMSFLIPLILYGFAAILLKLGNLWLEKVIELVKKGKNMSDFISATKARELSDKNMQDSVNKELDHIFKEIRKACDAGKYEITCVGKLSAASLKVLRDKGYAIDSAEFEGLCQDNTERSLFCRESGTRYIISWLEAI